jgi:prepilin-type N-terminal cleavage/methylation domain-containing protein
MICPGPKNHQQGYTLIELLLYVSLIGILLGAVTVFLGASLDAQVKNQSISEVEQQGSLTAEYIARTIRNADSITAPAGGTSAASLSLVVPTSSLSPTVFNLAGSPGALQVKEGAASAIPLTNSKVEVSNLSFTNLTRSSTPGVIQVKFTISRVNPSGQNQYDYQKTFTVSASLRK